MRSPSREIIAVAVLIPVVSVLSFGSLHAQLQPSSGSRTPIFYRSGEEIPAVASSKESSSEVSPFDQETSSSIAIDGDTSSSEVDEDRLDNELMQELLEAESSSASSEPEVAAETDEEPTMPAAPQQGFLMTLLNQLKYVFIAVAVAGAGWLYFFGKKKSKAPSAAK